MPDVTPLLVGINADVRPTTATVDGVIGTERSCAAGLHHRLSDESLHRSVRGRSRLRRLSAPVAPLAARLRLLRRARRSTNSVPTCRGCAHVHQRRDACRKRFLLGANYWSRAGGPRMWERFDEAHRARRAARAARRRARLPAHVRLRAHLHAAPAGNRPGRRWRRWRASPIWLTRRGCRCCRRRWSGTCRARTSTSPVRATRSLYRDPGAARLAGGAGARASSAALRDKPSVLGWILTNEMPLWGGPARRRRRGRLGARAHRRRARRRRHAARSAPATA